MLNHLVIFVALFHMAISKPDVGHHLETPECMVSGWPPSATITWSPLKDNPSETATYKVLYCSKPRLENMFCFRSNKGYTLTSGCTTRVKDNPMKIACDLSKVVQMEFPNLELGGRQKLCVLVQADGSFGTIQSRRRCCDLLKTRCTVPRNVRVQATDSTHVRVLWDAPADMGPLQSMLYYTISYTAANGQEQTIPFLGSINYVLTGLNPSTMYKISVACSLGDDQSMGPYSNPVAVVTTSALSN